MSHHIEIVIDAKFGSKFQHDFAKESLLSSLKTWKIFLNNRHNKNSVAVYINNDNIDSLDFIN